MRGGTWVQSPECLPLFRSVVLGPSVSSSCKWAWEPSECRVDLERLPVGNAQPCAGCLCVALIIVVVIGARPSALAPSA